MKDILTPILMKSEGREPTKFERKLIRSVMGWRAVGYLLLGAVFLASARDSTLDSIASWIYWLLFVIALGISALNFTTWLYLRFGGDQ